MLISLGLRTLKPDTYKQRPQGGRNYDQNRPYNKGIIILGFIQFSSYQIVIMVQEIKDMVIETKDMIIDTKDMAIEIKAIMISHMKKEVKVEPEEMTEVTEEEIEAVKGQRISITETNHQENSQREKKKIRSQNFLKNGKKLGNKEIKVAVLKSKKSQKENHNKRTIIIERRRRLKKKFK